MTTLFEELHPLAEKVEEARTAVVDAAREWCSGGGKAGEEEKLKGAVKQLDHAQMALGLKTAQMLLGRAKVEELAPMLEVQDGPPEPPAPLRRQSTVGAAWGKKGDEK